MDCTDWEDEEMQDFENECNIMELLQGGPNIIGLYDVFRTETEVAIAMPLYTGGEMMDELQHTNDGFDENTARRVFQMILNGVEYIHKMGVVHRDLKPENIFVDGDKYVIADFGMSIILAQTTAKERNIGYFGSPGYLSPEMLIGWGNKGKTDYDMQTDMWSLGVVLFMMLSNSSPFSQAFPV